MRGKVYAGEGKSSAAEAFKKAGQKASAEEGGSPVILDTILGVSIPLSETIKKRPYSSEE